MNAQRIPTLDAASDQFTRPVLHQSKGHRYGCSHRRRRGGSLTSYIPIGEPAGPCHGQAPGTTEASRAPGRAFTEPTCHRMQEQAVRRAVA